MKIIPQISVFDYSEIEILGDLERCKLLIDNVADEKIINKLIEIRGKGRNDYPVIPVWNSLLIMPIIECSTIEQLRRELSRQVKKSNNYQKTRKKLAKLYAKLKNTRKHNIMSRKL